MREGLATLRAMGAKMLRPSLLALLANACGSGGQSEAGLDALEEALVTAKARTEHFYAAERHRVKGELVLDHRAGATPLAERQRHAERASSAPWPSPGAGSKTRLSCAPP